MKSYHEMVMENELVGVQRHSIDSKEYLTILAEKMCIEIEERRIVRLQEEQNQRELEFQVQRFNVLLKRMKEKITAMQEECRRRGGGYTGSASSSTVQDEGLWEVVSKKSKSRGGTNGPKSWDSQKNPIASEYGQKRDFYYVKAEKPDDIKEDNDDDFVVFEQELAAFQEKLIAFEQICKSEVLKDKERDHEIIWPPMLVVMNTWLQQDENDKWIGMDSRELLEYLSSYAAMSVRHSYSSQGHLGMSVVVFERSGRGFLEAERLHKHFAEQGMGRNAWDGRRVLFNSDGKRQLYAFMAVKEDLDLFNRHSQGLKYEMTSYHEMVLENEFVEALEEFARIGSEELCKVMEGNRVASLHNERKKRELSFMRKRMDEEFTAVEEDLEKLESVIFCKLPISCSDSPSAAAILRNLQVLVAIVDKWNEHGITSFMVQNN